MQPCERNVRRRGMRHDLVMGETWGGYIKDDTFTYMLFSNKKKKNELN